MKNPSIQKIMKNFERKFSDLDGLTVEELARNERLETEKIYREYMYYNILMIKHGGQQLVSQLRKLRFEKFIHVHMELFYPAERVAFYSKDQIKWFNNKLTN